MDIIKCYYPYVCSKGLARIVDFVLLFKFVETFNPSITNLTMLQWHIYAYDISNNATWL